MGLALVEVVTIVVEDAFGIPIPDEDMQRIATPRALVDYLMEKLAPPPEAVAHSTQRAFTTLRDAIVHVLGPQHQEIVPSTTWESLLPGSHGRRQGVARDRRAVSAVPCAASMEPRQSWDTRRLQISERGTPGPQEVARPCARAKRSRPPCAASFTRSSR
jgi:hypothetical protein